MYPTKENIFHLIKIQTDRPSSQFWNSGMARGHLELAEEFGTSISHISEQSMHNKVRNWKKL
jgi:hypothetical protein